MDNNNDSNNVDNSFFTWLNYVEADKGNLGYGQPKRSNYEQYIEYIYRDRTYFDFGGCHRVDNGYYIGHEGVLT